VTWFLVILIGVVAIPLTIEFMRKPMSGKRQTQAPGEFADLPQGRTHFRWIGPEDGPVAVCVHGLTTPSFVWQSVADEMAAMGFSVLVYDHFGRGFSDTVRGRQDGAFFIQHLNDLMVHEHVDEPVTLVGYSMGGAVAAHFAAANPNMVERLILLAPAGMQEIGQGMLGFCRDTPILGDWLFLLTYPFQLRKGIKAEAGLPSSVGDIYTLQTSETDRRGFFSSVLSSLRGVLRYPAEEQHLEIAAAGIPVLSVWGADDDLILKSGIKRLVKWNPGSKQTLVMSAGHGLPYTHTKSVVKAIRTFCNQTGAV